MFKKIEKKSILIKNFHMDHRMLLRISALYEFEQGHVAVEAGRNIRNTYGSDAISESNCPKWFIRFKNVKDDHKSSIDRGLLKETVNEDPFLTTRDLENIYH